MSPSTVQHCFAPVARSDTRLIVLGSLPGARSLARGQYYAHPRNQFWRLIGRVIEKELEPLGYRERLQALLDARVGLWDTVAAATREGSLDANIRLEQASDLASLIDRIGPLRGIAFNGAAAARIGRGQIGPVDRIGLVDLPSSSPAHTLTFERKLDRWMALRAYL